MVGTRIKRSDGIFRLLLQASNRRKYGRTGRGGETEAQIERRLRKGIEQELRPRIEREIAARREAELPSIEAVKDEILRRLSAMGAHRDRQALGGAEAE